MGAGVEAGVESGRELSGFHMVGDAPGVRLCLFGPLRVEHDGRAVPLPPSRKVRALLGYLALAPRPVTRTKLCELLWDVANDPRGELRWCLAKLRQLLDTPGQTGLIADRERVGIDTSVVEVDALQVAHRIAPAIAAGLPAARTVLGLIEGELLEGLALERSPVFDAWLAAERQRFARLHVQALVRLAASLPAGSDDKIDILRQRLAVTPYDEQAHIDLMTGLIAQGRKTEAEVVFGSAAKLFASEGLDAARLRHARAAATATAQQRDAVPLTQPSPAAYDTVHETTHLDTVPDQQCSAQRPSVVIMRFASASPADQDLADGLTYDIIFGIAKLRSLMVIARGTAFALQLRAFSPREAATLLGVGYAASGTLTREGARVLIRVELSAAANGEIVWAEDFSVAADEAFAALGTITARIISAVDAEIHMAERNRALMKPPNSLGSWQAYHRGLWHMYRFTAADNDLAQRYFTQAIAHDPTFSRSHAGLSFTHFQNAFLLRSTERDRQTALAFDAAARALMADARDPAAHWAMGRALWLLGENDAAIRSLDEAVELSPNFALGHYSRAFVHSQSGDPNVAIAAAETSLRLSPFDPMMFAIQASKVFGLLRLDQRVEAGAFAREVLRQPNVHVHARAIAVLALGFIGHADEARTALAKIRGERPTYDIGAFLSAFRLNDDLAKVYREGARLIGLG